MRWGGAIALLVVACLASGEVQAAALALRYADGRTGPSLGLQRLEADSDESFVAANALCAALEIDRFWKPETRKLVLKVGARRIQVTVDTRLVLVGDDELLLRVPVRYLQGSVMLPLEFLERVLAPALGGGAKLDRPALALVLGTGDVDVVGIDYQPTATGTEVRLRLVRPYRYRAQKMSDEMVRVLLAGAKLDPVALAADQPAPLVRNVRAEQGDKEAAVYLEVDPNLSGVDDRTEDDGKTVVIALRRGAAPEPARRSYVRPLVEVPPVGPGADSFDLVALDAGHGGFDRGVEGNGLVEKDLTLQLAQALQPLLARDLGVQVLLVRSGDETISSQSRAEIANRARADVFISLHCNAWFDAEARGFEVLYAPPARSTAGDAALQTAQQGLSDFVPWNTAYLPCADRSRALAERLQGELGDHLDSENRGARPAALEVLQGAAMPSVVVELGFLTSPEDAPKLTQPEFAPRLAAGLVAALQQSRAELISPPASAPPIAPAVRTPDPAPERREDERDR